MLLPSRCMRAFRPQHTCGRACRPPCLSPGLGTHTLPATDDNFSISIIHHNRLCLLCSRGFLLRLLWLRCRLNNIFNWFLSYWLLGCGLSCLLRSTFGLRANRAGHWSGLWPPQRASQGPGAVQQHFVTGEGRASRTKLCERLRTNFNEPRATKYHHRPKATAHATTHA